MKRKSLVVLVIAFCLALLVETNALAATDLNSLTPNEYIEKEFRDNKEYLHNESLLKNKKAIPEEQKELDFIPDDYDPNEAIIEELFTKDFEERKTVAYEAQQLNLFSDDSPEMLLVANESKEESRENGGNSGLQYVYLGILVTLILIVLVLLIPKMTQGVK